MNPSPLQDPFVYPSLYTDSGKNLLSDMEYMVFTGLYLCEA